MQVPAIAPKDNHSGISDFMNAENSFLLQGNTQEELQHVMRSVYENISQAQIHAQYAREDLLSFRVQVSDTLFQAITDLSKD